MRLNAGGPHYVAKDGRAFSPRLVKGGGFMGGHKASSSEPVADTEDEALYQSYRTGMLGFRTPLTNGTYLVTLHFSEPMHTNINQRVFNVEIEEKPVFRKLDLFAVAGKNVARSKTSKVVVRDDELNITFEPLMGSPLINAIEVEPAMPTQKKKRR